MKHTTQSIKKIFCVSCFVFCAWAIFSNRANADFKPLIFNENKLLNKSGSIIVKPKPGFYKQVYQLAINQGWVAKKHLILVIENVPVKEKIKIIDELKKSPFIEYVEPETSFVTQKVPTDPEYSAQNDYLESLNLPEAWSYTTGGSNQKIAILDTGIDGLHEDLAGKVIAGRNLISTDTDIASGTDSDSNGHGTQIAGIAAAIANNDKGIAGINWQSRLVPIKVLDDSGEGASSDVADGIIWATDQGIRVLNLSAGSDSESQAVKDAIDYAYEHGTILVAASGNDGQNDEMSFPASYPKTVSVGSIDLTDETSGFSNTSTGLDFMLVGEGVRTTQDGTDTHTEYQTVSGTSVATPQMSGILALIMQSTSLSAKSSVDLISKTAKTLSNGFKKPDALKAVLEGSAPKTSFINQSPDLLNSYPGGSFTLSLTLKNTGATSWQKSGEDRIFLKITPIGKTTTTEMQRYNPNVWHSASTVTGLEEEIIAGENHTFDFQIKIPWKQNPGKYYFATTPFTKKHGEIGNSANWTIIVPEASIKLIEQSKDITKAEPGAKYLLKATFKNNGSIPWATGTNQLRLILNNQSRLSGISLMRRFNPGSWISPTHVVGLEEVIDPGESYTFEFEIRVPWNTLPGRYFFDVSPILNGYRDLPLSESANWTIIVPETKAQKVSQSPHFSAEKGQIYDLSVTLKNTGLVKWSSGTNAFGLELTDEIGGSLANLKEMKRLNYDWISATQVTKIDHDVAPGESYTFNFKIRIPWQITYEKLRFSLRPVLNNYLKLPVDGGVSWIIQI